MSLLSRERSREGSSSGMLQKGREPSTEKESIGFFPWGDLKQSEDRKLQDTVGPDLGEDIRA